MLMVCHQPEDNHAHCKQHHREVVLEDDVSFGPGSLSSSPCVQLEDHFMNKREQLADRDIPALFKLWDVTRR